MVELKKNKHSQKSALRNEQGAIMVSGVFVSAFLIGALYMLVGVSTALRHGELMQDGVDSAAFSVAQTHAKGMNLIALNNMIKVASIATLAGHAAAKDGAESAMWVPELLLCGTWSCWKPNYYAKPSLQYVKNTARIGYARARAILPLVINAAHRMQNTLKNNLALIAEEVVNRNIKSGYSSPIKTFFLSPIKTLPIEEESDNRMCSRVRLYSRRILINAMSTVPHTSYLADAHSVALYSGMGVLDGYCYDHVSPAMIPKSNALPGTEPYQIRAFAAGQNLSKVGETGVEVATWGKAAQDDDIKKMRDELSQVSYAQAEYYYSGSTQRDAALWKMNWRARLRRFQPKNGLVSDCARRGGPATACSALERAFQTMNWAIIH